MYSSMKTPSAHHIMRPSRKKVSPSPLHPLCHIHLPAPPCPLLVSKSDCLCLEAMGANGCPNGKISRHHAKLHSCTREHWGSCLQGIYNLVGTSTEKGQQIMELWCRHLVRSYKVPACFTSPPRWVTFSRSSTGRVLTEF